MKELLMGNEAVAMGALAAGVQVVAGYPGTPSTEALETIAKRNPGGVYVEWSVNEKAGAEVAAGAAYSGARSMVTMKQMGLNVAADPIMCVSYVGVKGGMVIYVADDPGPISSQTEQDTRSFGRYARIPVLDASSPEQAYRLVQDAFKMSENLGTPVILRSTTRVCHSCAVVDVEEIRPPAPCEGFQRDKKWVIFPRLSFENKGKIVEREKQLAEALAAYPENTLEGSGHIGIVCGGISSAYVKDAIKGKESSFSVLNIATPYPFPEALADAFMQSVDQIFVFEELDPYLEDELVRRCGYLGMESMILGKRSATVPVAGELSANTIAAILSMETGIALGGEAASPDDPPEMPVRPPVLCAGCPHRGAFYAVKQATKGKRAIYCGDIGCYTLGNAMPLDMVDTCLCMGAGITMAQGIGHAEAAFGTEAAPDKEKAVMFAFVGDSTFFASGITGVVNAVYNQSDMILCVLDNSTTAMTGHQPHPGMGRTMMGENVKPVDIAMVLKGIGVSHVQTVDPLDLGTSVEAVKSSMEEKGVRAIIFKSPCIAITKPAGTAHVDSEACLGCMNCIREIGCPAIITSEGKAYIDESLCTGCGLCSQLCPADCIRQEVKA